MKTAARSAVLACLLLGHAAMAFEQPAAVHPTVMAAQGTVQVLFTPENDAAGAVVQAIAQARRQVLVQAFSFTNRDIAQALVEAKRRGIDVQLIADAEQMEKMERSKVATVAEGGVPTFIDSQHDSAHNKVMIIDAGGSNPVVITGSFNFTHAAQYRNAENLLIFRDHRELTAAYLKNWQRHRSHSPALR